MGDLHGRKRHSVAGRKRSTATRNDVQHAWCKRYTARPEKGSDGRITGQILPARQIGSVPQMTGGSSPGPSN